MDAPAANAHPLLRRDTASERSIGTRANTARLLCTALRKVASGYARRAALPNPSAGMCLPLAVLWSRTHKFDAADPHWHDRDRFVLSTAEQTPLLLGLLELTGHDGIDRDLDTALGLPHPGLPHLGLPHLGLPHLGLSVAGAPGGQAIAMAVGMAIAERVLAARFGKSLVDHRIWAVCEANELSHGVTQEAAALAGQYRLDRLVLLADAGAPGVEDARPRFLAHGWAVKPVVAEDPDDIEAALSFALRSRKPALLWCVPGAAADGAAAHASPNAIEAWRRVGSRGAASRRAWLKRMTRHPQRAEFERVHAGRLPDQLFETITILGQQLSAEDGVNDGAKRCRQLLERLGQIAPEMLFGRLEGSGTGGDMLPGQYGGRTVVYGRRPHGSAACTNGIALHGGVLPVVTSALIDLVDQLPALRLAAVLGRRLLHVAVDPCGDRQPVELLAWLRAIPGLLVFRPGCAIESAECMELALRRADGPSLVIARFTPQAAPRADGRLNLSARGGYVLADAAGVRTTTLIASGPAVAPALGARDLLAAGGINAAVVSLPCWTLFAGQDEAYQSTVLGTAPRFGIEAGCRDGWDRWLNHGGGFIGIEAARAEGEPALSPDQLVQVVRRRLLQQG